MNFTTIYTETILLWPNKIDISDGRNIDTEGGLFPNLSKEWRKAEIQAEELAEWHQLMVWAIFSQLHLRAVERYMQGVTEMITSDCNLEKLEKVFAENLLSSEAGYSEEMKTAYFNDINGMR
jgi:hypothetical protein